MTAYLRRYAARVLLLVALVVTLSSNALAADFFFKDGDRVVIMGDSITEQAKAAGVRVAWCTPSPVEKAEEGPALLGYNETLEKYSAGVQQISAANNGLFVDQFHPFVVALDTARAVNPKNRIGGGDAV